MLSLRDLQKLFVDGLNAKDDGILEYIQPSKKLSAEEHIRIYQSSVFGAKQKVLSEIYPVCHKLVGDEFFLAMINNYIPNSISRSPDLASYGADFYSFIQEFEPAKSLDYLSDVARLEWAWHKIYNAPNASGIDFQKLAACYVVSGEKIIFSLPPDSSLLSSSYPILRIWEVNQDSYEADQTIILPEKTQFYLMVWRDRLTMRMDILSSIEYQILSWVKDKHTLGDICEKVNELFPDVKFEEMLPNLVQQGWIAAFAVRE
jgi:hypothetical protein